MAKQAVSLDFFGFSDDELPDMAKLLPVAHEWLRK